LCGKATYLRKNAVSAAGDQDWLEHNFNLGGIATDYEIHDSEEEDEYHMVGVEMEMSLEKPDSTADSPSPEQ
jgi:hypothetical protein